MTIERRLRIMLIVTAIFGVATVFTIVHIAKSTRFHQVNSRYFAEVNELAGLLNQRQPPPLKQLLDKLYTIRNEADKCVSMTSPVDRAIMYFIQTREAINLCRANAIQAQIVINRLENHAPLNPWAVILDNRLRISLLTVPETLRRNTATFETLITETVKFTIRAALWFIIPFSMLVIILCHTIIRSVTRNAQEYRETAEALAESEIENRKLAYYDSLTGLPNRNLLADRLSVQPERVPGAGGPAPEAGAAHGTGRAAPRPRHRSLQDDQ